MPPVKYMGTDEVPEIFLIRITVEAVIVIGVPKVSVVGRAVVKSTPSVGLVVINLPYVAILNGDIWLLLISMAAYTLGVILYTCAAIVAVPDILRGIVIEEIV